MQTCRAGPTVRIPFAPALSRLRTWFALSATTLLICMHAQQCVDQAPVCQAPPEGPANERSADYGEGRGKDGADRPPEGRAAASHRRGCQDAAGIAEPLPHRRLI